MSTGQAILIALIVACGAILYTLIVANKPRN